MTIARSQQVDPSVARWYHCVSRYLAPAHFLLGDDEHDRKGWIENRIEEVARIFAIAVGGFSVMDNHLHVLLARSTPNVANDWSNEEVVRRWGRLFPARDKFGQPLPLTDDWVQWRLADCSWVATARERLQSISWFMKCLKEPLSRLANRQDKAKGAFFESRFKSVAILDEESLLAIAAYIDLNPVAAGIAEVPETSEHTSIKVRGACGHPGQDRSARGGRGRERGGFGRCRRTGRVAVVVPDRGPSAARFLPGRHAGRILAGKLFPTGRLHGAALSRRKVGDLGGTGRHPRSARE